MPNCPTCAKVETVFNAPIVRQAIGAGSLSLTETKGVFAGSR
jgi:hypothetical protein